MRKALTSGVWTWVTLALALVCIVASTKVIELVARGEASVAANIRWIEVLTQVERALWDLDHLAHTGAERTEASGWRSAAGDYAERVKSFRTMAVANGGGDVRLHALLVKFDGLIANDASSSADTRETASLAIRSVHESIEQLWRQQSHLSRELTNSWRLIQVLVVLAGLLAAFPAILLRFYHRDLMERTQAEAALRESEERFRRLVDVSPEAILVHREGKLVFINSAGLTLLGAGSPQALVGESILTFVHPGDHATVWDTWEKVRLAGQGSAQVEQRMVRLDKSIVDVEVVATPFAYHGQQAAVQLIVRDITERKRSLARQRGAERRFQDLIAHLPDGVFRIDEHGRILDANLALASMLGFSTIDEVRAVNFQTLFADPEGVALFLHSLTREAKLSECEVRLRRKDGAVLVAVFHGRHVEDAGGGSSWEGTLADISGLKDLEDKLRRYAEQVEAARARLDEQKLLMQTQSVALAQARDAAVESSRLKSEFLANVSHELRTPMNGVLGMLTVLDDTRLTAEQREYADSARRSAEFLLGLINDILDFSSIEAGRLKITPADFSLRTAASDVLELLAERAELKGLELACLVDPATPDFVRADSLRLRQVLSNLVGNAIKFTEQGEITLRVKPAETAGLVRFEVQDTGTGIGDDERKRLFQPFTQVDGSSTRRHGGSGLGLVIARQLVEAMKGEIGLESALGRGSTFWFTLPVAMPATAPSEESLRRVGMERALAGKRALLAVMAPAKRAARRRQVANWGVTTVEARHGLELMALLRAAAAQHEPFDVVLLEAELPDTNAFRLAEEITHDEAVEGTRLVLLSPFGRRSLAELSSSMRRGFSSLLPSPVRHQDLLNALAEAVGYVPGQLDAADVPLVPIVPSARILVAEDNAINQKVALRLLQRLGYEVDLAGNGREAIQALSAQPYALVLMDCQMPELDGFEATREIRRREGSDRHVPIIAMTAHAMQGDRERCLAAGMDDYLTKPVAVAQLQQAVAKWAGQQTPMPAGVAE